MSNIAALQTVAVTLYSWMVQEQQQTMIDCCRSMGSGHYFTSSNEDENSGPLGWMQPSMDWMRESMDRMLRFELIGCLIDNVMQQLKRESSAAPEGYGNGSEHVNGHGHGHGAMPHHGALPCGSGDRALPVKNGYITSDFGLRCLHGKTGFHAGIDIAAAQGTPIHSTCSGVVVSAGWNGGYGKCVVIAYEKNGKTYSQLYGHCEGFNNIHPGQKVKKGQLIAFVGTTGHSTGFHLHYEERVGKGKGTSISPKVVHDMYPKHRHG